MALNNFFFFLRADKRPKEIRRIQKFTWMDGSVINCQQSEACGSFCSFWPRIPSVVVAQAHSQHHPLSSSQSAIMLPCCLSWDEVTIWGFACNLPLVTSSKFQQERDFVYPILCCLPKGLVHSRNSVFTWHRQAFPGPTLLSHQPPQCDWLPLA